MSRAPHPRRDPAVAEPGPPPASPSAPRFRLLRYFMLSTLVAFAAVAGALLVLQRMEEVFFETVQREQRDFFAQAQAELARQNAEAARASLMAVHEASHVTLTRVVANLLWASDIAPFVARAQSLDVSPCRALPRSDAGAASDARRSCLAALGARIRSLPGFPVLDRKAYATMRATKVIKIKVWDLRGVAVYSSEHAQVGDDGAGNEGWRRAAAGQPASELTHRDRFSAFEGVVENRDLISSYVPVHDPSGGAVVGVFELYSDVTPFLDQTRAAARRFAEIAAANEARVVETSRRNQATVNASSDRFLLIVGGLLVLLYAVSLVIVRIGQRIIDRQTLAEQRAAQREQLWHREKMAALAAMAANVSHEVGNPLAAIAGIAQQLPDAADGTSPARAIHDETVRIAQMMRRISDFTDARSGSAEWVDVNAMLRVVCDFQAFDRRFRGVAMEFRPASGLPARELVPDRLNELMMGLLQSAVEGGSRKILVQTALRGDDVVVRVEGFQPGSEPEPRIARQATTVPAVMACHGTAVEIVLAMAPDPVA